MRQSQEVGEAAKGCEMKDGLGLNRSRPPRSFIPINSFTSHSSNHLTQAKEKRALIQRSKVKEVESKSGRSRGSSTIKYLEKLLRKGEAPSSGGGAERSEDLAVQGEARHLAIFDELETGSLHRRRTVGAARVAVLELHVAGANLAAGTLLQAARRRGSSDVALLLVGAIGRRLRASRVAIMPVLVTLRVAALLVRIGGLRVACVDGHVALLVDIGGLESSACDGVLGRGLGALRMAIRVPLFVVADEAALRLLDGSGGLTGRDGLGDGFVLALGMANCAVTFLVTALVRPMPLVDAVVALRVRGGFDLASHDSDGWRTSAERLAEANWAAVGAALPWVNDGGTLLSG